MESVYLDQICDTAILPHHHNETETRQYMDFVVFPVADVRGAKTGAQVPEGPAKVA
jgi:hypothetical protein